MNSRKAKYSRSPLSSVDFSCKSALLNTFNVLPTKERDNAEAKQRDLQREIDSLNERLEASQRAWTATKRELAQYEGRYTHLDREAHNQSIVAQNAETQYRNMKETLARMLCDDLYKVEPYEEQIREHIQRLQVALREKTAVGLVAVNWCIQ